MTLFAASAQTTHFAGETITGVETTGPIKVVLVKSAATKVVVAPSELSQYIRLDRKSDGVVRVDLDDVPDQVWRRANQGRKDVLMVAIYLPQLQTVRLSGASLLESNDVFASPSVDVMIAGASKVDDLDLSGSKNVKFQTSGASSIDLRVDGVESLILMIAGASKVDVDAKGVGYSKIAVAGTSKVEIEGSSRRSEVSVAGVSWFMGEDFAVEDMTLSVDGVSNARVKVSDELSVSAVGMSNVYYYGEPKVDIKSVVSSTVEKADSKSVVSRSTVGKVDISSVSSSTVGKAE